jgi:tetratricopeptide (TPR) repeat protein
MNNPFRSLILVLVFFTYETDRVVSQVAHSSSYISSFHEGVRHKLNGEITQAISKFSMCLNNDQNDDAVHYALYQIYSEQNELQLALTHIKWALKIDPSNKYYKLELANSYSATGGYKKAAILLGELIKNDQQNIVLYEQAVHNCSIK